MSDGAVYRSAVTPADKRHVMRLRDLVYVRDQHRITSVSDMAETFDGFDAYADYILAEVAGEPVGTVKVTRDSPAGLPCETVTDLGAFRAGHTLVEVGHLMTLPGVRHQQYGMGLMRAGLWHGIRTYGATRLVGDFFADDSAGLRSFYRAIGFVPLAEPYTDTRFAGAPLSVVAGLDFASAAARIPASAGKERRLLEFFFGDYAQHRYEPAEKQGAASNAAPTDVR